MKAGVDRKTASNSIHGRVVPPGEPREPERFFGQCHRPGERLQLDWFGLESLGLVIAGESVRLKLVHFGMKAATIGVAQAHQNGDVESVNGALKRDLDQALKLRGSREFGDLTAFEAFVEEVTRTRNAGCRKALEEELAVMPALRATRLPEYEQIEVRVGREGIARVGKHGYSVPTRWIGRRLRVRLSETEVIFYDGVEEVERAARRSGDSGVFVDWRHVIADLVCKPGAFARWRHRESLFPSGLWRQYYRRLCENGSEARASREYVHSLHLALEHGLEEVEGVLEQLAEEASWDRLRAILTRADSPPEPVLQPDLSAYDSLLFSTGAMEQSEEMEVCHG